MSVPTPRTGFPPSSGRIFRFFVEPSAPCPFPDQILETLARDFEGQNWARERLGIFKSVVTSRNSLPFALFET